MVFGQKLSVEDFKANHNCTSLQIIRNPKNDKLFVTANGKTVAAVSKNYKKELPKEFVELQFEDTGVIIWCLHNANNANVEETL